MKWIIQASTFEDSDHVISIRPDYEEPWRDVPIGSLMSERNTLIVRQWLLDSGLADLLKIMGNVLGKREITDTWSVGGEQ